ncbi:MAG: hypothetical protein GVY11_02705 [Gammaproteobacteria bacterium]|jgi:hypothetical protein|nr:hypothetical protein [Gammaproteobacteria bacterium]
MPIPDDANTEKLAELALAIMWLTVHDDGRGTRVWKSIDWDVTDLLFEKGWISDPRTRAKSVRLSDEAERLGAKVFAEHFGGS